ncbi:MAG: NADH-quinone oxidoreductase subunit D [Candidatus Hydrothermarchaeaceae archaeon]
MEISKTPTGPSEMILNLGPQHPSTHGVCRLVLKTDGEKVLKIDPVIGYLHRGIEKLGENRSYVQFLPLPARLDYVAAMSNDMAYVMAIEDLMDVEVPERAEYIRVIMLELQRLASHLLFVGTFGADLGAWTVLMYGFRERERILDLLEMVCGGRLFYTYIWPGGVRYDLPDGFVEKCRKTMKDLPEYFEDYQKYFYGNEIFLKRCEGVGVLKAEDAINWGVTGPILRACGVPYDVRKDDPYSVYEQLDFKVITEEGGDALARFNVRLREIYESINIINQALDKLPEGDFRAKVSKTIKPPAGPAYSRVEAPRGELSFYLLSDGESKNPYRVKIRSPSFCNLSAFPSFAEGDFIPDLIANFASIDIVLGCVDR